MRSLTYLCPPFGLHDGRIHQESNSMSQYTVYGKVDLDIWTKLHINTFSNKVLSNHFCNINCRLFSMISITGMSTGYNSVCRVWTVTHLSPGSDLPRGTLLLLARLHRLRFRWAAKVIVEAVLTKLTPCLTVLVAFPTSHEALWKFHTVLIEYVTWIVVVISHWACWNVHFLTDEDHLVLCKVEYAIFKTNGDCKEPKK